MSKPIGKHFDGSDCYTKGCSRQAHNPSLPSRKEFSAFMTIASPGSILTELPLKEMDAGLLTQAIRHAAERMPEVDQTKLSDTLTIASYLHRNDMRSNRGKFNQTPYIEHPLRNTLRVMRYGCHNEAVLLGTVLHDTVEDHPFDFSRVFAGKEAKDEAEARENCYAYIKERFGSDTEAVVKGMSNPLGNPKERITTAEKNARYVKHVVEEIDDPKVFVSKFSDWVDNAVGLYHNVDGMNPEGVRRRAVKYSMLVEEFRSRLLNDDFKLPVSAEGRARMLVHLNAGAERLRRLAEGATVKA